MKQCRADCRQLLPLTAFGRNAKYADGKHIYCRDCCRQKVSDCRAGIRRVRVRQAPAVQMSLPMRVLEAIRSGANTEHAIARRVKVHEEILDGILAELILDRKEVVTKVNGDTRLYFTRRAA